jgi:hypothetical protein
MKIENPYQSIEELIEDSSIWFMKPTYQKPAICMFEGVIVWYYFENHGYRSSSIRVRDFPEGDVKEKIKTLIRASIEPNFHEIRLNRYHRWIGEVDVTFVEKESSGNFNLYFTKSSPHDLTFAGIDYCKIWLEKPRYIRVKIDSGMNLKTYYEMEVKGKSYIAGKVFRKTPEIAYISSKMWKSVVNSFDLNFNFEKDDMADDFYMKINNRNHKKGMSSKKFFKVFFFDLILNNKDIK